MFELYLRAFTRLWPVSAIRADLIHQQQQQQIHCSVTITGFEKGSVDPKQACQARKREKKEKKEEEI